MPAPALPDNPTPADCAAVSASYYREAPLGRRLLMSYRPYICPLHRLLAQFPRGARVLDVGCGGGLMLVLLAAAGRVREGVGFDSNASMIRLASQVASAHGLPLTFEHRGVEAGLPEGAFDVISMIDVMHHVPPSAQPALLDALMQRVRPGGMLIYKDMCRHPRWRSLANRAHDLALARQWIHYLPIQAVDAKAREHGLVEAHRETMTQWWYGHELSVLTRPADDQAR